MLLQDHRDFRLLWIAQLISQMGDKVYALTLSWWVLELTVSPETPQGDPSRVGYMMAVGALAATVFGPWLGTLADRYPRGAALFPKVAAYFHWADRTHELGVHPAGSE